MIRDPIIRKAIVDFKTADGVKRWMARCGFASMAEAYTALEIPYRSWYRMAERGLPLGWPGDYVARRMWEVENKYKARKK